MYIPSTSGWLLKSALAVANVDVPGHVGEDWIVGYGTLNGETQAFLLTPSPVAEPSTLLLLSGGLAGLAAYAWRKRR